MELLLIHVLVGGLIGAMSVVAGLYYQTKKRLDVIIMLKKRQEGEQTAGSTSTP